jgi:flavin-dependent dehydrogenase
MEMDNGGYAVDRADLDFEMVQHAQRLGVRFLAPAKAKLINPTSCGEPADSFYPSDLALKRTADFCIVQTTIDGITDHVKSKTVIIASGLGNRVARDFDHFHPLPAENSRVGVEAVFNRFPNHYRSGVLTMAIGNHGYVGLTHIGNRRLHVAAAVDKKSLKKDGPQRTVAKLLKQSGAPLLDQADVVWRGTPPLTAKARSVAEHRVFLIGDAAGYVEPFTGEGIRWALQSGIGVAPFVARAINCYDPQIEFDYRRWYEQTIVAEQKICRRLSAGLKRPLFRWAAHQALRWRPTIADSIIRRLNS